METEKVFMNLDENLQFSYSTLNNLDLENVDYYVEITRHLQEIYHLYQVLMYTLGCVKNNYILLNTGEVLRSDNAPISESDYIVINAMVNNVISAGRTLVEAMECYINVNFDENDVDYEKFFKCLHDTYDTSFAYRLLTRLRDYSQHGHLPVSQNGDWFGFDLYLICIKPHYKHNAQIKQQLEGYIQEVTDVYGDIPRLGLSMTLAEYSAKLLSVYNCFWICVKSDLSVSYERMKLIVEQYPDNVNCLQDDYFSAVSERSAFAGVEEYFSIDFSNLKNLEEIKTAKDIISRHTEQLWEQMHDVERLVHHNLVKYPFGATIQKIFDLYDDVNNGRTDVIYWLDNLIWLQERFPDGVYRDVVGLCKVAKLDGEDGIIDQDYSLNPGRYVGVVIEDDGMTEEEFKAEMLSLNTELAKLNDEAHRLEVKITDNLKGLFE